MRGIIEYAEIVAIKERSAGNDTVGDMWIDTKTFTKETPISEIVKWASDVSGKLIITINQPDKECNF